MAIKTYGIDHIHLNVPDMDRFREVMKQLFELDAGRIGHIDSIQAHNAVVRLGGGKGEQPFLDVFEPASPGSPVARHMARHGAGVSFISFRVDDIEAAAAHAVRCGLKEGSPQNSEKIVR